MVRFYHQKHTYNHPWDRVTSASFRKFTDPTTPTTLSHILNVHTLSTHVDPTGSLHVSRSITIRSPPLPFLLRRLLPVATSPHLLCHCVEKSTVDPLTRSMTVVTTNCSLRSVIEVEEKSIYEPDPESPERRTLFRQETSIRCRPLSALAAVAEKVESRCAERFMVNSAKGREVVERICNYLEKESSGAAVGGSA